jgi:hypothetical protein
MEGLPPHTDGQKMREFNWNIGRKKKKGNIGHGNKCGKVRNKEMR